MFIYLIPTKPTLKFLVKEVLCGPSLFNSVSSLQACVLHRPVHTDIFLFCMGVCIFLFDLLSSLVFLEVLMYINPCTNHHCILMYY